MLDKNYLATFYAKKDPFPNLLARSTYLSKYCRDNETWTDTIARVVLGNVALDKNVTRQEAEQLFYVLWRGIALPPGRGLWTGGVPNIPVDARYNCHAGVIRSVNDWGWVANMLMCGGGVGVSLHDISWLPRVEPNANAQLYLLCNNSHPNVSEVLPAQTITNPNACAWQLVPDSRQGWVDAIQEVLSCAFAGHSLAVNLSSIRARGELIRTFGGIACGPGPLATLLRNIWAIVRGAAGRKLTSVECLDITNHIGVCIKSGNVRRSALLVLGDANDIAFRKAKQDYNAVLAHRHTSNNSIALRSEQEVRELDYKQLVQDNLEFGDPGILNLHKVWQTDPFVEGFNPCAEIPLENREACCLSEVYPAKFDKTNPELVFKLITRYTLRQRLQPMSDPVAESKRTTNMRIGIGLGGICDFEWTPTKLKNYYSIVRNEAKEYAEQLGVNSPNFVTTVKPSGTISLLNGSSPGIHAPFAEYYIRRTRIAKYEPMAQALLEAGVPSEQCVYDSTGQTLVFSFPMKAANSTLTVQNDTITGQIKRQVEVQKSWADNAVSTTISFSEHETEELAGLLQKEMPNLKSVSLLHRQHGYEQPPYSEITADKYSELYSKINHNHPLTKGGELEVQECDTGACPVR